MIASRGLCCSRDEIAKGLHKPNWIKRVIDHECCQSICSIKGGVCTLLNGSTDVQALSLQSCKKAAPVRFGSDNDNRIPILESSADKVRHVIKKPSIIRIEPHLVATGSVHVGQWDK